VAPTTRTLAGGLRTYLPAITLGVVAGAIAFWVPTIAVRDVAVVAARDYVGLIWMAIAALLVVAPCGALCAVWSRRAIGRGHAMIAGLGGIAGAVALSLLLDLVIKVLTYREWPSAVTIASWPIALVVLTLLLSIPFMVGWAIAATIAGRPGGSRNADALRCAGCGTQVWGAWFDAKQRGYVCRVCGSVTPEPTEA
jgi:ACR3 family arsenite efflux pump ArsB